MAMVKGRRRERLDFWFRQLAALTAQGQPVATALQQIAERAGPDAEILQALAADYRERGRLSGISGRGLLPRELDNLLQHVDPAHEPAVLVAYATAQGQLRAPLQDFFERLRLLVRYFVLIGVALVLLLALMATYVLPEWAAMMLDTGNVLPTPTAFLAGLARDPALFLGMLSMLVLAMLLALGVLQAWTRRHVELPTVLGWVPALAPTVHAFRHARALQLLAMLIRAGLPLAAALGVAAKAGGSRRELEFWQPLWAQAAAWGTLESELVAAADAARMDFEASGRRSLQWLLVGIYLTAGLVIGFILIAFYLPIFTLGGIL